MAKTHLTDAAVERYRRPQKGRTEVSDSEPGLFLWITPNGTKSWVVICRLPDAVGKRTTRRKIMIGRWPEMGVTAARETAREMMKLASAGIDPEIRRAEEEATAEQEMQERDASSFRVVSGQFVTAMKAGKLVGGRKRPVTEGTAEWRESLLKRRINPELGERPLTEVTPQAIARLLARIEKEDGPVDAVLHVIRCVFAFAASRGLFHGAAPTLGMRNRQAPEKKARALTADELRSIWSAARQTGGSFGLILRLLMLTGQRKNEIAALRWDEVDFERKMLVVPVERVKNRAGAHEVPLTAPAIEVLTETRVLCDALGNKSGLVFPSASEEGDTPISGWEKLKAHLNRKVRGEIAGLTDEEWRVIRASGALRAETRRMKDEALARINATPPITPWRIHDLRHTFITCCRDGEENAEGEITWSAPLDVLQAVVNHEITAGVTARYDHGDLQRRYRLRKRELLEWWSRKLMTIVKGPPADNIVPMAAAGRQNFSSGKQ